MVFHIQGLRKWRALPFFTIFASKVGISAKGTDLSVSLWKAWFRTKEHLKLSPKAKDLAGFHRLDFIWWLALPLPRVQPQDLEDALIMHKLGIKIWKNLWDDNANTWMSRANLIASYNLFDWQLEVIGKRLMQWDPGDWWHLRIKDPHLLPKVFQWSNQRELWPIPPVLQTHRLRLILNRR